MSGKEDAENEIVPCSEDASTRNASVGPEDLTQKTEEDSLNAPAEGSTSQKLIVISSDECEEILQPRKRRRRDSKRKNKSNKNVAEVSLMQSPDFCLG